MAVYQHNYQQYSGQLSPALVAVFNHPALRLSKRFSIPDFHWIFCCVFRAIAGDDGTDLLATQHTALAASQHKSF